MEIVFIERANKFFESLFNNLQIDLIAILFVWIEIVREKDISTVKTFHFSFVSFQISYSTIFHYLIFYLTFGGKK